MTEERDLSFFTWRAARPAAIFFASFLMMENETIETKIEYTRRMQPGTNIWLKLLTAVSRVAGCWVIRLTAWVISTGFFFFRPKRLAVSLEFYRALFPERGRLYHLYCAWKQFHAFAASHADVMCLDIGGRVTHDSKGFDRLKEAAVNGRGGILVTSHLGSWEIGARLFKQAGLEMTLLMGQKDDAVVGRKQKEGLASEGLGVNVSAAGSRSPLDSLAVLGGLRQGGLIAIAGDIAWTDQRQRVPVTFLGRRVHLPATPHFLALVSRAPLYTVFACRTGRGRHYFETLAPRYVQAASRDRREEAVRQSAQQYANDLEAALRRRPWQWAVFEPFLF